MNTIHDLLLRARTIVGLYVIKNPKFEYEGVLQDPNGAHQLLLEINDALKARVAELERDAARYRWLTEDHADPRVREKCRELLGRIPHMSYAAASYDIDAAIAASKEKS